MKLEEFLKILDPKTEVAISTSDHVQIEEFDPHHVYLIVVDPREIESTLARRMSKALHDVGIRNVMIMGDPGCIAKLEFVTK